MRRCAHLLLTDKSHAVELSIEASAALGTLRRAEAGCVRYLLTRLWTQQKIPAGDVNARKVNTALNCAGLGSKELARDTILRLMHVVQIYDIEHGCVVGEQQMCDYLNSHATRAAACALRFKGGPRIPKLSV